MAFAFNKDKTAEIFFRAFKDCAHNIICNLPSDASKPEAVHAIHTIAQQLNGDYNRLVYVSEAIQARIREDGIWAVNAAVDVYELLATTINPNFSAPNLPMTGALLVRNELMKACQTQFQQMMKEVEWSPGFIGFLGQLCTTCKITSTTPGIVLHILDSMISSISLTVNDNFDLLVSFFMCAGPYLDSQAQLQEHLTVRVQQLQQRTQLFKISVRLAVHGLVQVRERGWLMEAQKEGEGGEQQVYNGALSCMSTTEFGVFSELNRH